MASHGSVRECLIVCGGSKKALGFQALIGLVLGLCVFQASGRDARADLMSVGASANFTNAGAGTIHKSVAQFDSSLGTLDKVVVSSYVWSYVDVSYNNKTASPWNPASDTQLGYSRLVSADVENIAGGGLTFVDAVPYIGEPGNGTIHLSSNLDGQPYPYDPGPSITTFNPADASFSAFIGTGTLDIALSAGMASFYSGSELEILSTDYHATASLSISYFYTPVPEPTSLAIAGLGLIGFAGFGGHKRWVARRRRTAATEG